MVLVVVVVVNQHESKCRLCACCRHEERMWWLYIFEMSVSAESERYGARSGQVGKLRGVGSKLPNQLLNCNSFRWRSVNSWNRLPLELRQLDSHAIFKQKLKSWVQKNIEI